MNRDKFLRVTELDTYTDYLNNIDNVHVQKVKDPKETKVEPNAPLLQSKEKEGAKIIQAEKKPEFEEVSDQMSVAGSMGGTTGGGMTSSAAGITPYEGFGKSKRRIRDQINIMSTYGQAAKPTGSPTAKAMPKLQPKNIGGGGLASTKMVEPPKVVPPFKLSSEDVRLKE
jgi:hypothetical protein